MLGDFDADGDIDVLSGSYPGELYLFRKNDDGSFADGETLKDKNGDPIKAARASTVFATDWDADGDLDLVLGSIRGDVYLVVNEGTTQAHAFGEPVKLELSGDWKPSNSGPIVADWDADGLNDLLVGTSDGSAHWFRNTGSAEKPEFAPSETLVEKSGFGFKFQDRKPGMWGARVKLCATDFNGDGRLDLLLGDRSGSIVPRELTEEQQETLDKATQRLTEISPERAKLSAEIRNLKPPASKQQVEGEEKPAEPLETDEEFKSRQEKFEQQKQELQDKLKGLTEECTSCRQTVRDLGPETLRHGFVWLFLRKPAE